LNANLGVFHISRSFAYLREFRGRAEWTQKGQRKRYELKMPASCSFLLLLLLALKPLYGLNCTDSTDCNADCTNCEDHCGACVCGDIEGNAKCNSGVSLNEHCVTHADCLAAQKYSECNTLLNICKCRPGFKPFLEPHGKPTECRAHEQKEDTGEVDMAVIGILLGFAAMFIVICIVFQMFAKERFRDNRSIFNTPNPRLMNASFAKNNDEKRRRKTSRTRETSLIQMEV